MMKTAPTIVTPENKNTHPCIPIETATVSKTFTMTKASTHDMQKHIVQPMLRTFSGITSEMTTNIRGIRPFEARNIMPEKLAIDTHE